MNSVHQSLLALTDSLGETILIETFKYAAFYALHSNNGYSTNWLTRKRRKEAEDCFAFVRGTGLEILLQSYHLDYDADSLRNGFNYYLRKAV